VLLESGKKPGTHYANLRPRRKSKFIAGNFFRTRNVGFRTSGIPALHKNHSTMSSVPIRLFTIYTGGLPAHQIIRAAREWTRLGPDAVPNKRERPVFIWVCCIGSKAFLGGSGGA
jgi:hypothetical protein